MTTNRLSHEHPGGNVAAGQETLEHDPIVPGHFSEGSEKMHSSEVPGHFSEGAEISHGENERAGTFADSDRPA